MLGRSVSTTPSPSPSPGPAVSTSATPRLTNPDELTNRATERQRVALATVADPTTRVPSYSTNA